MLLVIVNSLYHKVVSLLTCLLIHLIRVQIRGGDLNQFLGKKNLVVTYRLGLEKIMKLTILPVLQWINEERSVAYGRLLRF